MASRNFCMGVFAAVLVAVVMGPAAALADWNVGDAYKMHYPQLPKVDGGWDVMASYYLGLADDWQCTETGFVNDIHTWVSFKGDQVFDPTTVHLAIWSDDPIGNSGLTGEDPVNTYSKPLERLWHGDTNEWIMRLWDAGPQGWFDPRNPSAAVDPLVDPDHEQVYQMNFLYDDQDAFWQEQGNIYWLEFSIQDPEESLIGWKESDDHFMDDAVWRIIGEDYEWIELLDPLDGLSMDMAFVITPEPASLVLVVTMLLGLLAARRRR